MRWLKQQWVRALISLGLLAWLARSIDWAQLAQVSVGMAWPWALASGALYTVNRWLTTAKWWLLMRSQGLHHSFQELLHVVWVSNFLGHFLPASVGGDHVRMFTMASRSPKAPEMVSTVLMERMTGTSSLGLLALLGASWSAARWGQASVLWAILPPTVVLVVVAQVFWSDAGQRLVRWALERWHWLPGRGFLQQLCDALRGYRHHGAAVLQSFGISVVIQLSRVLAVYCLARGLSVTLFLGEALVLVPTALFLGALPISVAGWGVREGAFVMLLGTVGVGSAAAFALSVWSRLMALISNLPGAFFYFSSGFAGSKAFTKPVSAEGPVKVLRVMDKLGYEGRLYGPARMWYATLGMFDSRQCVLLSCVLRARPELQAQFAEQGIALRVLHKARFDPTTIWTLYRLIRREQIDVVHLHGDGAAAFGRLAAWLARVPAVVHYHDTAEGLPWYVRSLDALLAPLTTRAIAISATVAEACQRWRRIPPARIVVVPNAVDLKWAVLPRLESSQALREQWGIPPSTPVVGTVTRFQPVKDVPLFLEAVARLRHTQPAVQALIVGDGPQRARLEAQAEALGVQACVHFMGYQKDVRPYLALMDVVLFTSRSEGFCLALLEAMSLSRACVATQVGGMAELIQDGVTGRLVQPGEPAALAQVADALLHDEARRLTMGQAAASAAGVYSVQSHVERMQRLYAEVAAGLAPLASPQPAPLRVLWLADKLGYGDQLHDVGRFYLAVLPHLAGARVAPAVLRATPGLLAQLARHGVRVQDWHLARFDPRTLWRLVQCIRSERIGVLHVHGYGASTFGRLAGWLTRTPVIVHQHDSAAEAPGYVRLLDRLLAPLTAQAIAVSETAKECCIEGRSMPLSRVQVWPNGVMVAAHLPDPVGRARLRRALGVPEGHRVIGTIGRLTADKGLRYLLDAAARVIQLRPNTLLLIIGEGAQRQALEAQAQRLGIGAQVRWLGDRADAEELLGAMDCFALASVTEGSPFELLEAMGAGAPIVATAVGGTLDILRHGQTGWLVPSRDPRSLADGLVHILDNARTRDQLASEALSAVRKYDVRAYAQRLSKLYHTVAASASSPAAADVAAGWRRLQTFVRYAMVGVSGGTIHVGTLWALVEKLRVPVLPATTAGFLLAVINNFIWNRLWTFRSRERNVRLQFTRFLAVSLCGFGLNNFSMAAATTLLGWPYLAAQLATMVLVWGWNFFANTYWTFQPLRFRVPPGPQSDYPYDLSIVVPAYNEEARLPATIEAMARYCAGQALRAEILVVDDGSTDRTLEVATQLPAEGVRLRLIHQPVNQGKGAAVRAGFRASEGAYVLMADADNSIPIECLEQFWAQRAPDRLLIGSRYLQGRSHQPDVAASRYWMGRMSNWLIRAMLLPGATDSQCGFKFFSYPIAKALAARQRVDRFGFDMELIAIARALGIEVREVGIRWQPIPGSRVRPLRDAWRSLGELALIKWSLWSGVYHTEQRVTA